MATSPQQVDIWRNAPSEHQRLELKEAKTQFDNRKLYEYCIALANGGGGIFLLGIADKPPHPVVGAQAFNDPAAMAEKLLMAMRMTNQSLRERFHLPENKSAIISQIIAATIEAGKIKPDEKVGGSRKYARYLPFWA